MKAILVIDKMPSNCLDCPCEYDFIRCKALNHQLEYCTAGKERPSWCPLKPMPIKRTPNGSDIFNDYVRGRNDCIEEIENDIQKERKERTD